ncbi:MAG: DUF924 family protein [Methylobacteriaceae bacterium]|nr:DUF924 family protein [Methylobacteriaceae bacterium]MBV9703394.1 DUF924 family protein [Methylobacteriaceae bacterium]
MAELRPQDVLDFWLAAGPDRWFQQDKGFDEEVRQRLLAAHEAVATGAYIFWIDEPASALALLILLDQVPRNIFRGTPRAYAADALALAVAAGAVEEGFDQAFEMPARGLFYLPFMHAECLADQERGVALYRAAGDGESLGWAIGHRDIIARFGRFPHRNAILGRASTPEERRFLDEGGFAGQ